jgi:pheromone shutdown protein TraB
MITLVGVGHVFQLRKSVQAIISGRKPDIVCIELDEMRYHAILERRKGHAPTLMYRMLSDFQERLAESYGSSVGDEMMAAVEAAQEVGASLAFIDMDASMVFKRVWSELTLKERFWMFITAIGGVFITKRRVEKELKRFEEHQEQYMKELEQRFPTLKRILIDERNEFMATRIKTLQTRYPNMVAVLGDGHIMWISRLLEEHKVDHEVLRLSEIREEGFIDNLRASTTRDEKGLPEGASISFSFQVDKP